MKNLLLIFLLFPTFYLLAQTQLNTITDLKNYSGNEYVYVKGYHKVGDGGGGYFLLKQSNSQANNGTIFNHIVNGSNKKWIRIHNGPLNIRWFGAKGDDFTDDTTSISNAIEASTESESLTIKTGDTKKYSVYVPFGTYKMNEIIITGNVHILGEGILKGNGLSNGFKLNKGAQLKVSDLTFDNYANVIYSEGSGSSIFDINKINVKNSLRTLNYAKDSLKYGKILGSKQIGGVLGFQVGSESVDNLIISDNEISNLKSTLNYPNIYGIHITDRTKEVSNLAIVSNTITNINNIRETDTHGILINCSASKVDNVYIATNTVQNINGAAPENVHAIYTKCKNTQIINNSIFNSHGRQGAISIKKGALNSTIKGNYINYNDTLVEGTGIWSAEERIDITNNSITNAPGYGIALITSNASTWQTTVVKNNIVRDTRGRCGIYFFMGRRANLISNNTVYNTLGTSSDSPSGVCPNFYSEYDTYGILINTSISRGFVVAGNEIIFTNTNGTTNNIGIAIVNGVKKFNTDGECSSEIVIGNSNSFKFTGNTVLKANIGFFTNEGSNGQYFYNNKSLYCDQTYNIFNSATKEIIN